MSHPTRRWCRLLGQGALLAGITLLLFSVVLEATLRLFPQLIPSGLLEYYSPQLRSEIARERGLPTANQRVQLDRSDGGVPHRFWRFVGFAEPHGTRLDEQGFCNSPGQYGTRETFDLITLGDSFTYCWFAPQPASWPAQLARHIGVSVYNLALPDMGPYEDVEFLRHFGLAKSPDAVVLAFYEGNDLRDALKHYTFARQTRTPAPVAQTNPASRSRRAFYWIRDQTPVGHSYGLSLLLTFIGVTYVDSRTASSAARFDFRYELEFDETRIKMNEANVDSDELEHAQQLATGALSFQVLDEALQTFATLAAQRRFHAIVVYLPSAHNMYRDHVAFRDPGVAQPLDTMHERQRAYLDAGSRRWGYTFIDLTRALRSAAEAAGVEQLLVRPNDLHLTAAGHAHVAAALAPILKQFLHEAREIR